MNIDELKQSANNLKGALGKENYGVITLEDGFAIVSNGVLSIKTPCQLGVTTNIDGDKFIKTILACDDTPQVKLTEKSLVMKSGSLRVNVSLASAELRVSIPDMEDCSNIIVDSDVFRARLDILKKYVSTDTHRITLNGVCFKNNSAYATNGHMAARIGVEENWVTPAIIPLQALAAIKAIKNRIKSISYNHRIMQVNFEGDVVLSVSLIDGRYPDVDAVINPVIKDKKYMSAEVIKGAIGKLKLINNGSNCYIFEGATVMNEDGDVVVSNIEADFKRCAFNGEYIITMMDHTTEFNLDGDGTAGAFINTETGLESVIMPIRL